MDKEEQDRVRDAVEEILAEADIKQVSEKQVRESASKKTGVDLSATREWQKFVSNVIKKFIESPAVDVFLFCWGFLLAMLKLGLEEEEDLSENSLLASLFVDLSSNFFSAHSIDDSSSGEILQNLGCSYYSIIMDPFWSPPPSGSGSGASNEIMMDQVKQQLAQASAEEFFSVGRLLYFIS
jgi:hypothetical protein